MAYTSERIHARGAMIKVLDKPHLDFTTRIGRGFIAFLSALAEDERQRIVKRANDGRVAARKRGCAWVARPKPSCNVASLARASPRVRVPVYRLGMGRGSHHRSIHGSCAAKLEVLESTELIARTVRFRNHQSSGSTAWEPLATAWR